MRSQSHRCYRAVQFLGLFFLYSALLGCGGQSASPVCKLTAINVLPKTATVNHTAAAPGNTQHFDAFDNSSTPGCVHTLSNLANATWSVSDTTNISISNAHDVTYGTATCGGATTGAATVTATAPVDDGTNVSSTSSLTCN